MKAVIKMALRTIRTHFTRFVAIFLIVALSAGFFAGLKITTEAMLTTGEKYYETQEFYDFRLFSTIGFDKDELNQFEPIDGIKCVEGTYSIDALMEYDNKVSPYKIHAITEKINLVTIEAGRMPISANECLADVDKYTVDDIGKTFVVADENSKDTKSQFNVTEFTIVGLCNSPLYLGIERGSTTIGSGAVNTFIYILNDAFNLDVYTEINIKLEQKMDVYSEEYDNLINSYEKKITRIAEELTDKRFEELLDEYHITAELAEKLGISAITYVLTRNENSGYVSFENDTEIIGSVAYIFPIFFISIAILVCVTTMSRMVDEERTQIGTLKALGFSQSSIIGKYLLYAAIATFIGWTLGYFLCIWGLPKIFWIAYGEIYNFAPLEYVFSLPLAILTLAISFVSILGTTYISCRNELAEVPASLIRPRAAKVGKRVLLERIKFIWNRLSFLRKITIRNMLLYKRRVFMMLLGIGCCAGLLVTAFGIHDSMINVSEIQFNQIQDYNIEVSYDYEKKDKVNEKLLSIDTIDKYLNVRYDTVEISEEITMSAIHLISYDNKEVFVEYWHLLKKGEKLELPQIGEAIISPKIAEKFSLKAGDTFEIRDSDMKKYTLKVSEVYDNHIMDYIFISSETYVNLFEEWSSNMALIKTSNDIEEVSKQITEIKGVTGVNQLYILENNISEALQCLNYIILLAVLFSAALAFIVIFNLTNINIAERRREIATVQVLGFYPKETESYVLKENLILSVIASILGLPLGKLFHLAVMEMVHIDAVHFNNLVNPISYVLAFVCSILFAVIVNQFMKKQINKINMAESLKAVE